MSDKREQAEALLNEIRDGLVNVEARIKDLIEMRGWEALGYKSFGAMWTDRLRGITLAKQLNGYVLYQLIEEGMSDTEAAITAKLPGVGRDAVAGYREQRARGIGPTVAPIPGRHKVEGYTKNNPGPPRRTYVELGEMYGGASDLAKAEGVTLSEWCTRIVRASVQRRVRRVA